MFTKITLKNYNFKLLTLVITAIAFGTVVINSAESSYLKKQIIGAILGLIIIFVVSIINYDVICKFAMPLYIFNIVLLLLVLLFGREVNNAKRWIQIGGDSGVQIQPSELSKMIMILVISVFLAKAKEKDRLNKFRTIIIYLVILALPLLLIAAEPDLSTTICLTLVLITLYYIAGVSYKVIGLVLLIVIPLAGSFLWYIQTPNPQFLKEYQIGRILDFVYPGKYGDDYSQQRNSIMAIGSGQLSGKGLNSSTIATVKDANFISEQQTDFIFSVIGEELGFVGSVFIIVIILLIVLQCIKIARRAKDHKGMLIATGVAALIAYQSFINIGVATGVLPNTGIPLPFVSYGLSSLWSISIGIGLLLNISLQQEKY